jgi:hypothetical protein
MASELLIKIIDRHSIQRMEAFIPLLALLLSGVLAASCDAGEETGTTATTTAATTTAATTTATTGGGGTGGDGAGGTGGAPAGNCGFGDSCSDGPVDPAEYCAANDCGDVENVAFGFCAEDGDFVCKCVSGECSDDECFESSTCTFDEPGNAACAVEAATVCGGAEMVREAFCFQFFDGPRCEFVCQVGGPGACQVIE